MRVKLIISVYQEKILGISSKCILLLRYPKAFLIVKILDLISSTYTILNYSRSITTKLMSYVIQGRPMNLKNISFDSNSI